ncbi:MAG: DUF5686 and carboxypeptidase regulatory-like domain-containing protein [Chitinophagaceae bacterium]
MKLTALLTTFLFIAGFTAHAGRVTGLVTDDKGNPLPYASILVKGTTIGTTTNAAGKFFIDLAPGKYTLSCQYIGYDKSEKAVEVSSTEITVDFKLTQHQTTMKEVVISADREDPAYEIIRNAIKKRKTYQEPLDSFTCEAYIKTLVKTRKLPKRILGQKIEEGDWKEMGVDSNGKGIIYLSESLTKIASKKPGKVKLEVLSGRESGSGGYGFNFPTFINFYNNNVNVFLPQMNPRGFVSPVADGALNYYKYKYLGSFWEDGKEINEIQVIPRRNYEPLFSGTINITEGDWRIHSLDLMLTKTAQLEIMDTLKIKQMHVPVVRDVWQVKDQVIYFTFNKFGIDAVGNFLNVYNKYEVAPKFSRKFFNNIVAKYDTAVNKKSKLYWDSIRPVALEPEEARDFKIKDSAYEYRRDSVWSKRDLDSIRHRVNKPTIGKLVWSGYSYSWFNGKERRASSSLSWHPLLKNVRYNSVEGVVATAGLTYFTRIGKNKMPFSFTPMVRYGFNNTHLNTWATMSLSRNKTKYNEDERTNSTSTWSISGGKRVSQFNKENPITPLFNSVTTLFLHKNYMKIYENYYAQIGYAKRFDNSLTFGASLLYEDRLPIDNTTDFSFFYKDRTFTPNYPYEKLTEQFPRHQAVIASVYAQFRPGEQYVQFPTYKMAVGSKYPTFSLQYQKGIDGFLGSDVNFDKWKFSMWDDVNLKLRGMLKYRLSLGGFINDKSVYIQDYQHFNGNQLILAAPYLNSFQVAPYYANSTTASFYAVGHLEHHFNGMLTNKIPLFKRLNWHLVGGSNAFYVNRNNNYVEVFAGLENILKVLRVDVVGSYLNGNKGTVAVRIGFGGLLGGSIQLSNQ